MRSGPLRILALASGVIFLFLSIMFSANGLGFAVENKFAMLVGWVIGITFTVVEFVFNEEGTKHNSIMIIMMGIFCYIYGIYTNIVGLFAWSGIPNYDALLATIEQNPLKLFLPLILSLIFELGAEPLILWGLTGDARDFFNGLLGEVSGKSKQPKPQALSENQLREMRQRDAHRRQGFE